MAFRSLVTNTGTGSIPDTGVPAGLAANDIVIIVITIADVSTSPDVAPGDMPAGVAQLDEVGLGEGVGYTWVGWARATGSELGFDFGAINDGSARDWAMTVFAFSGRDTGNPPVISTKATNTGLSSPVSVAANGVTALAGDDILMISAPSVSGTGNGNGHTAPGGYTEPAGADLENGLVNSCGFYLENVSAGATGTITATFALSAGTSGYAAWTVRMPSAAGGGPRRWFLGAH